MKQFAPDFEVIHWAIMSGDGSAMNITEQLGESCTIHTSKGIYEPYGTFTISFLDREIDGDSLYALVAPMDGLEIKVAHDGVAKKTCIMRGFVSAIRRDETMGADGRPSRRVTLTGQDVGKLWTTLGIFFLPNAQDSDLVLARVNPLYKFVGDMSKSLSGDAFVGVMTGIIDDQLQSIVSDTYMGISLSPESNILGDISPGTVQAQMNVTFHNYMSHLLDVGAIHELWIDDPGEGAAILRCRVLYTGGEGMTITERDIEALSVWRDDSRVSNWFWYWPREAALLSDAQMQTEALQVSNGAQSALAYLWSSVKFFGYRLLNVQSAMLPPGWATNSDQPPKAKVLAGIRSMTEWIENRTQLLKDMNKDNVRREKVSARISGNEYVRPGLWHTIQKADTSRTFYAVKIEHDISFFGGFTTTIHGERNLTVSGSPYKIELNLKGAP